MNIMTPRDFMLYLGDKFPEVKPIIKDGTMDFLRDKAIGVYLGSDTRTGDGIDIGGIDCTSVRALPINIQIRWTNNSYVCDKFSNNIYAGLLLEENNFMSRDFKIAFISLLDPCPVNIGRDERGACMRTIRANVYYYV